MEILIHAGRCEALSDALKKLAHSQEESIRQIRSTEQKLANLTGGDSSCSRAAMQDLQQRLTIENRRAESIAATQASLRTFAQDAIAADKSAAKTIQENRRNFYKEFSWMKPSVIQSAFSSVKEFLSGAMHKLGQRIYSAWNAFQNFCNAHKTEIHIAEVAIGTAAIAAGAVLTVGSGGTLGVLGGFLAKIGIATIAGTAVGTAIGGALGGITAAHNGENVWAGIANGAKESFADSFCSSYLFAGLGGLSSGIKAFSVFKQNGGRFTLPKTMSELKYGRPCYHYDDVIKTLDLSEVDPNDFREDFFEHIFRGNKRRKSLGGGHVNNIIETRANFMSYETITPEINIKGPYNVKTTLTYIKNNGRVLSEKKNINTIFPPEWSPQRVWKAIVEGYKSSDDLAALLASGMRDSRDVILKNGLRLKYVVREGKIITVFPIGE